MKRSGVAIAALTLLASCGGQGPATDANEKPKARPAPVRVGQVVQPAPVAASAEGTTPMAERAAVIGLLNKRNGISTDLQMKPGEAMRVGDVIVRLRACETTAPWEPEALTGAFLQLDVQGTGTDEQFRRAFSGWVYKETPSLNVVEHPVYDVWPKSCAMTHPGAGADTLEAPDALDASSESSSEKSGKARPSRPRPARLRPERPTPPAPTVVASPAATAGPSNDA